MKYKIEWIGNNISIYIEELDSKDRQWVYDYFESILKLKLPLLLGQSETRCIC